MAIETLGATLRQISRLLEDRAVTGFSDAQLLERFVSGHDAAAFEALVARHGPMVLSVCRGVLRNPEDAEDAFQATFLILVKKLGTVRGHVALGPWLYQVAYRVAIRGNAAAARRRACERQAGKMAAATSKSGPAGPDEPLQALHEEIARLPEKLRRAIILCDLQRVPQDRAATELRLSERTIQRRLSEGRKRLKARLIRRGLAPQSGTLGAMFLREAQLGVPAAWAEATVRTAVATVNSGITLGAVSAAVNELTHEVLRIMLLQKLTLASASLLAAGLIAWGASAALFSLAKEPSKKAMARPYPPVRPKSETPVTRPEPNLLDSTDKVSMGGRVLGLDEQPVAGAKLYLTVMQGYAREPFPAGEHATTGPDGRFAFTVSKSRIGDEKIVTAAIAANHGVGWLEVPAGGKRDDMTLRLVNDDVPINGQVVDLEGKPVPGAVLRVLEISAVPGEDLGPWLEAAQGTKEGSPRREKQDFEWDGINVSNLALKVTTDADGRFLLTGMGRNRLVRAQLDGPVIASQYMHVITFNVNVSRSTSVTRNGNTVTRSASISRITNINRKGKLGVDTYYGANFVYVAAPTKPVVGMVRDKDTRKPLAGMTVETNKLANDPVPGRNIVQTTTDAEGRYRLTGLPKGKGSKIRLVPRDDQPYVSVHALVPDSPGLDPVTVDFEVKRGIWIEGNLTDKVTGKPVQGSVDYFALDSNPNVRDHPGFDGTIPPHWGVATKKDGSFRVVGLPGPGLIAVFYTDHHLLAPDRDDEYGIKQRVLYTSPRQLGLLINYTALARIDPAKGIESVKREVTLDPGWTFTGTVLGPDGKPLFGARSFGLTDRGWPRETMKTAEFTVRAFNPRRPRDVFFQHLEKGLVGVARAPKENGGSVAVQMKPSATIIGRLIDVDGTPRAGVELEVRYRHKGTSFYFDWSDYFPARIRTDPEGRLRIEALLPGHEFRLSDGKGILPFGGNTLQSGQTKNLGDVKIKAEEE
jgi:RNA polymerase sigma factor (sigma-70 family)